MKAIVLVARGLQAGALGCYGNPWIDTPSLDGLAADAVVFDQHFADAADPAGARRAWRTGRYHLPLLDRAAGLGGPDLLAALRAREVYTCLVVDDSRPASGDFTEGWDEVARAGAREGATALEAALDAAGEMLERLERRDDWLLWIDLATPLPPWDVPDEFLEPYFTEDEEEEDEDEPEDEEGEEEAGESEPLTPMREVPVGPIDPEDDYLYLSLQTSYAAAVTYLDAGIRPLLEALANLEGGEDVLLFVTSDVGQNLGEHGIVGPARAWLHDEVLHLPLLVRLPGGAGAGRRVGALTQAVDLAPTLAEWFGAALPGVHGHNLLTLARGEAEAVRTYACAGLPVGAEVEYALRTPEWAFLLPATAADPGRTPRLYVKPDDRWEVNDVRQHHLDLADGLEKTLRDFVAASAQPGELRVPPLPEVGAAPSGEPPPAG